MSLVIDNTKQILNEWGIILSLMMETKCFIHKVAWSKVSYRYSVALDPISNLAVQIMPWHRKTRDGFLRKLNNVMIDGSES